MKKLLLLSVFAIAFLTMGSSSEEATNNKITICHIPPGNPENAHSITISINALNAHLAHGDAIGECNQPQAM